MNHWTGGKPMSKRQLSTNHILRVVAGAMAIALMGTAVSYGGEAKKGLAALVESMPKCDGDGKYTGPAPEVAQEAILEILKGGKDNIVALVGMLKEPDKGDDYKAHYLLHAAATHARRPGAEDERRVVSEALASTLSGPRPTIVKAHVLEELKWIAGEESVAAISKLLLDKELYDFAVLALRAIKAAAPMRAALPKAQGRNRVALIQALGELRDAEAAPTLLRDVANADRDLRLAAILALAKIGAPAAVGPMLKAADVDSPYERSQVIDSLLTLAHSLGEADERSGAERISRHLLKTCTGKADSYVRCGALIALARAAGARAMDDVLAAMSSEDPGFRAAGFEAAIKMPGEQATQRWVQRMKGADAARRVAILDLLAKRGDPAALPAVLGAMKDPSEEVRVAALNAAGPAGDERAVAPLIVALTSQSTAESVAARSALLRVPGKPATAAIAKAIPTAAPALKVTLLAIVASREGKEHLDIVLACTRDKNAKVSAAAIAALGALAEVKDLPTLTTLLVEAKAARVRRAAGDALAGACSRLGQEDKCVAAIAPGLERARGEARAALYRILAGIGNRTALEVVRAGVSDQDAAVRDAAIRGLVDWPDDRPAGDLLRIATATKSQPHHVLALRGYLRMVEARKSRSAEETLKMCQAAMRVARRPDEKRQAFAVIGNVSDLKALRMAEAYLKDKEVVDEAAMAVVRVARAISGGHREAAKQAIEGAMLATDSKAVHRQAKEALNVIEQFEDFVTGWMAAGPYPGGIGNKKSFPPEDPKAKDVKWKLVAATGRQPGVVDLHRAVSRRGDVTAYLRAQIWSPKDQDARVEVGTDDGVKVWVNDKLVHVKDVPRSLQINQDKVPVTLKEGWNTLLLRVTEGGGDWAACARVRAADGTKLKGIRLKAE